MEVLDAAAAALEISGELTAWSKLTTQNLHPFRLKVKELRSVLQLSGGKDELIEMLGEVKDTIGEWHDWTELSAIAADVLQHEQGCELQKELRSVVQKKLEKAMELAHQLRAKYFNQKPKSGTKKRSAKEPGVQRPVLESAAKLAA
jgi:CHAD domain-containing protein